MASPPSSARRHGPPLFGAAPPSPTQGLGNSLHCLRCEVLAATYGPMIGHTVLPVDVLTLIQERWDKNERVFKSNDDDFHLPFGQLTSPRYALSQYHNDDKRRRRKELVPRTRTRKRKHD